MTPEQERLRAGEAEQLLKSPMFQEAKKHLEEQLAHIRNTVPISDSDMHTRVILMGQLANTFFSYFEKIMQTGKFADMRLREEQEKRTLAERGVALWRQMGRNSI
jgi:hypothetical protein